MKEIPIDEAKRLAEEYDFDQVIIYARHVDVGCHFTTYGRDKKNCEVAGHIGWFLRMMEEGHIVADPRQTMPVSVRAEFDRRVKRCSELLEQWGAG